VEQFYKIEVRIGQVAFVIESHDKEWLECKQKEIMGDLLKDPERVVQLSKAQSSSPSVRSVAAPAHSLTIQEFFNKFLKGKSRTEIALYFVYYYEKMQSKDGVVSSDIKEGFKRVAYPAYGKINVTDILNQSRVKGYLNKEGNSWKLTVTGADFILNGLQENPK
jgi:ribosome-binding ATPase YchF (GTP1/OBG family)